MISDIEIQYCKRLTELLIQNSNNIRLISTHFMETHIKFMLNCNPPSFCHNGDGMYYSRIAESHVIH